MNNATYPSRVHNSVDISNVARRCTWTAVAGIALVWASTSQADDLQPPSFRGGPLSTVAEWDFLTPNAGAPDGTSIVPVIGNSGGVPLAAPGQGVAWDPFDGSGAWVGLAPTGGLIGFEIPNWIDKEPIKFIQVQMTYLIGPVGPPSIVNMVAQDPAGISSITQTGVVDFAIPGSSGGMHQRVENWQIRPNPDQEFFQIQVPVGTYLSQVVVDTISVPEPSTAVLASLAALALGLFASRRRRVH